MKIGTHAIPESQPKDVCVPCDKCFDFRRFISTIGLLSGDQGSAD